MLAQLKAFQVAAFLVAVAATTCPNPASAQGPHAATATPAHGAKDRILVFRNGRAEELKPGAPLYPADQLITRANSSAVVNGIEGCKIDVPPLAILVVAADPCASHVTTVTSKAPTGDYQAALSAQTGPVSALLDEILKAGDMMVTSAGRGGAGEGDLMTLLQ